MKVITTPTGNIGGKVLARLLDSHDGSEPIRVLVRDRSKLAPEIADRVEAIEGSLEDPETLSKAFQGADSLFWCQPDSVSAPDYVGYYEQLAARGAAAIKDSGINHVVVISSAGETPGRPAGPITALHRMEEVMAQADTGAAIRFLRCGSFFSNLLWQWDLINNEGRFVYPLPGDVPNPQVANEDIVRVAADLLQTTDWSGIGAVSLPGPEDLTFDQVAGILTKHLGKPVRYESMDPGAYKDLLQSMMGYSPGAAQGLVDMFACFQEDFQHPTGEGRSNTPTTLDVWLSMTLADQPA